MWVMMKKMMFWLEKRLTTLNYQHMTISMSQVFIGEQFMSEYWKEIGEIKKLKINKSDPLELQTRHGEKVREQQYEVLINMMKHLSV